MFTYILKKVRFLNTFFFGVPFLFGIAVVIRWLRSFWIFKSQIQTRFILLERVRRIVDEWEEPCLREVEHLVIARTSSMPLLPEVGKEGMNFFLKTQNQEGRIRNHTEPFHGAVPSVAYAPSVDLTRWLCLWRMGRFLCTQLVEDVLLVERLGYIIKYIAFRRLALMSEARYYAAALRSAAYGGRYARTHFCASAPRIPPWLVGRRPFWFVPLESVDEIHFLCLPLSYFPVEAILTHGAEETWIKEMVEVLPLMTEQITIRYLPEMIWARYTRYLARLFVQWKYPVLYRQLWGEIDRLFTGYAVPLAIQQLQRRKTACKRFYKEKLFEGIELVSGEGPDMDEWENEGSFFFSGAKTKTVCGREVLIRNASVSHRLQIWLRLRSLSHIARVIMSVIVPQYNFFAEWFFFESFLSVGSTKERNSVLVELSYYVLQVTLASIVGAFVRSFDDILKAKICTVLFNELAYELHMKLAIADEAFLRRCVEEGVARRDDPVKNSLAYAEAAALQILARFDYEKRKLAAWFVVFLFSVLRQEADIAIFAAITAQLDYHNIAHIICCWLGITVEKQIYHELKELEKEVSLEEKPRCGLQLMMDLLVEERNASGEGQHLGQRKIQHPHLSLVVCGGIFSLEWPSSVKLSLGHTSEPRFLRNLEELGDFLGGVINYNAYCSLGNSVSAKLCDACLNPLVDSLKQNAVYIREFVLKKALSIFRVHKGSAQERDLGKMRCMRSKIESFVDTEEIDLLHNYSQAGEHIPQTLCFEDVFDKQPRFILRQLGLETVFAYRAALMFQQGARLSIMESLIDFFSSPFHNMFAQIFVRLMEFTERVLFYAFVGCRFQLYSGFWSAFYRFLAAIRGNSFDSGIYGLFDGLCGWKTISLLGRMGSYRAALRENGDSSFDPPFRLAFQIARYLPTTLHDASQVHYSPFVEERRRKWRTVIKHHKELQFDGVGRIVGGFSLTKGVKFSGVYFVYPQLHRGVETESLWPTLCGVTAEFPAGHMTALVGKTGSGKSTLLCMLKRMYDPVPLIKMEGGCDMWVSHQGLVDIFRRCLCATLPMPFEGTTENTIFLDDIPLSCFSTSYLRSLIAMLEQSPYVSENLTFFQNISFFNPAMSMEEIEFAIKLCHCEEFIKSRPLAQNALTGQLSSGEKHRLALARAVAVGRSRSGILLLDEPTARLDGYNGSLVEESLAGLLNPGCRMTVVIVSHRLSALCSATYAVVLEDGKVECHGPLQEVLSSSRYFGQLLAWQGLRK